MHKLDDSFFKMRKTVFTDVLHWMQKTLRLTDGVNIVEMINESSSIQKQWQLI